MSFITNLNQQQRKRLHQITLVATFGGLLFGYDTGVINGAFSSLKQYMALTPTTEGLVMSVLLVGAALGSVFGGKFADYFGRRKYLLFLSFVFLIGALLSAAAPDITTLLIARALLGYAVGGASVTAPTFTTLRNASMTLPMANVTTGYGPQCRTKPRPPPAIRYCICWMATR